MAFTDFLPIVALLLLGYICVYSIISRICECFERCSYYDAYSSYMDKLGNGIKLPFPNNLEDTKDEDH